VVRVAEHAVQALGGELPTKSAPKSEPKSEAKKKSEQ
jgi:hypothetical protein